MDGDGGGQQWESAAAALDSGAANARVELVRRAIAAGADVRHAEPRRGSTALHRVAVVGDGRGADVVDALAEAGADVEARANEFSMDGATPLFLAVGDGNVPVVLALLARGANPNTALDNGCTALEAAVEDGRGRIAGILLAAGAVRGRVSNEDLVRIGAIMDEADG